MGIGPQVVSLYIQLKRNGTFDDISQVMELGSQDMVFRKESSKSLLVALFESFNCNVPFDEDLDRMANGPAKEVYENLGLQYNCLDSDGKYNALALDLNTDDVPSEHKNRYDLVTNHGTTEHLINQLNGFKMVHDFTESGGLMLHVLPFTGYIDHGYFNYQPNFFKSLAKYNFYQLLGMWVGIDTSLSSMIPWQDNLLDYVTLSPSCNSCLAVLMKKKSSSEFSVPFQGRYESTQVDEINSRYHFTSGAAVCEGLSFGHLQNTSSKLLAKELGKRVKSGVRRLFRR